MRTSHGWATAAHPQASGVSIASDGLRFSDAPDVVVDVLFDGRRVWSFVPSRHAGKGGSCTVPWHEALRPYLDGRTRVTVREHVTGRVLADREHRFGAADGRVRVVDDTGNPLAVTKLGRLQRPFDTGGPAAAASLLDQVSKVIAVLRDECGLPAFISYGALLGATREGKLIGHDNDADVAYLSAYSHPVDVIREGFRIERTFQRCGMSFQKFAMGDFKVKVTDADGTVRGLDVFAGFMLEDQLCLMPFVRAPLPRSAILPLGEVEIEGRRFPAPADPPAVLEATYGPEWRVPDPTFRFRPPPSTRRRLHGWMRGLRAHHEYWNDLYGGGEGAAVPREPSSFARWVGEREPGSGSLIDLGSGNGRDALWFARSGRDVLGLDFAFAGVTGGRAAARAEKVPVTFEVLNLYDLRQVLTMGARLAADDGSKTLYGRFLLDALEDEGRQYLWRFSDMTLRGGGRLYLEFRTSKDAEAEHAFGAHYRRFLDPDMVVDEIEAHGGRIEHREEGHGLAPFREEDPHICRLVVGWQR